MSDPFEDYEYLTPGFDPQSLRVAELRRIFFEHNIDFKSAAKKSDLVQIFNDELRPQANKILQTKLNPAPSSNKIEAVGQASPVVLPSTSPTKTPGKRGRPRKHPLPEEEEAQAPPPSAVKKPAARPRKVPKIEEGENGLLSAPAPPTVKKSPSRRKTVALPSDTEMSDVPATPAPKSVGRPRKSTIKREIEEPIFSSANPFQSGSPQAQVTPAKRRQTVVPNSTQKLSPPAAKVDRRKTESSLVAQSLSAEAGSSDAEFTFSRPIAKTPKSAIRKSERFMPPISSLKASPAFQSAAQRRKENSLASEQLLGTPVPEPSEEFTPEETATLQPARKKLIRKHKGPSVINQALKWTSLMGLSAGSAYAANWYRQEKINAGYCGIDSEPIIAHPGASGTEDLINAVRPQCVPCPPHAICSQGFRMSCEDEFEKVRSPLSFGGLFPISPKCAPDTEKLRRIQIVADEIVETLRDRTASVECGYISAPGDGQIGMSETELKSRLSAKKSSALSSEQFTALFDHAMEDVKSRDEIEISSSKRIDSNAHTDAGIGGGSAGDGASPDNNHVENYYHSTSLANISIACSIRHSFFTILARYRVELVGLLTFGLLSWLLRQYFMSRANTKVKVQVLVTRVYDELATTKAKAQDDPQRHEPHLGVSQLRDSILADEFSYSTRKSLWDDVQSIVERNSNVRATQAEIQGEWLRAWEWVGPVRRITAEEKRRELGLNDGDEFVRPVV